MLFAIIGMVGTALAVGAIAYLGYQLTVAVLKSYKKKKTSKLLAAQVKDLIKQAPTIKLDDLDADDVVLAEYDTESEELAQPVTIAKDADTHTREILDQRGGIVVFD